MESDKKYQYWLVSLFRRHPALLVSAFYVIASFIGMLFAWDFLRHFGINVFHYSQVSDFLMASLKEPMTWLIVLLSILMMLGDNAMSRRWQEGDRPRLLRWYGSPRYRNFNYVVVILVVIYLIDVYARVKVETTKSAGGEQIRIKVADSDAVVQRTLLGTTGTFIFVYDDKTRQASALPIENVLSISSAPEAEVKTE